MYISGIGKTKFGILNQSIPELAYEAMSKALEDSKQDIMNIDMIYVANFIAGPLQNQLHLNSLIASLLPGTNIPIIRIESACASSGAAVYQAALMTHKFNNIMVVGVEKMTNIDVYKATKAIASASDSVLDQKQGAIFPATYALIAQEYMSKYGLTKDDLSLIALKAHENANLNELAHFYGKEVTLEMIRNSPVICSPLKLFDCSPVTDGATALIISKEKKSDRDIRIIGSSFATDTISLSQRKDITTFSATKIAAKKAYEQAGISPGQIDFAEVHDCFTIAEVLAMEDLGFCEKGKSKEMIRSGETKLDGRLPIGTGGGLKAGGHPIGATGASQIYEIVKQLRREAGKRQIKNANIGMAQNIGGVGGSCAIHILKR
nr:3-ketoacyl-CoA thiolase [uncultured archaeon]